MQQYKGIPLENLLKVLEPDYKVIFVGDACMAPSELLDRYGDIYYHSYQKMSGLERLKQLRSHFSHAVWLNPDRTTLRSYTTVQAIAKLFPMFELTIDGLNSAIKKLTQRQ